MQEEVLEEELAQEEPISTEEDSYDAEYEKAWSDEEEVAEADIVEEVVDESLTEEDNLEQPVDEVESEGTPEEATADEDSKEDEKESSKDFFDKLKWNGQEIPVTREEAIALAQKGFDSQKKWQEAAINRPLKEAIDKYGITAEQLEMLGNIVKDKNPEALALLAKQSNIDLYDAEHNDYKPVVEQKNYALDDVIDEINQNEQIATEMNRYVSDMPQSVKDVLVNEPEILRGLNIDMQNGIAQRVMPEVIKQLAINPSYGKDFVRLYQDIGQRMFSQSQPDVQQEQAVVAEPKSTREDKKRVAVNKHTSAPKKQVSDDYDAAWEDDKHFEAVRRRLSGF